MNKPRKKSQTERDEDIGTASLFVLAGALLMFLFYWITNIHLP